MGLRVTEAYDRQVASCVFSTGDFLRCFIFHKEENDEEKDDLVNLLATFCIYFERL